MAQQLTSITYRSTKADGTPNALGSVSTYLAGTLTNAATYTTAAGDVANTNPVTLGADGCAQIWLDPALTYRFIERDAGGTAIPGRDVSGVVAGGVSAADLASTASGKGSALLGFKQAGTGAKDNTVQAKLRDIEINANDFTGVDPTGNSDSYAGLIAARAAVPEGGTLVLNGYYRSSLPITFTRNTRIVGKDSRIGNLSDYSKSASVIVFTSDVAAGFDVDNCVVTVDGVVLVSSVSSTGDGIRVQGDNSALIFKEGSVVQGFNVGIRLVDGDYSKIEGTVTFCKTCIVGDGAYNLVLKAPTLRCFGDDSVGITLENACSMTMHGGSVENFTGAIGYGIGLFDGSSATLLGTYFEGSGGPNILLASNAAINAIGCHVYLNTGTPNWMKLDGAATGVRIFSRNHRFVYPTDTSAVAVYDLNTADQLAFSDIAGDYWNPSAGANVDYLSDGTFSGAGPVALTGAHTIVYPMGHPLAHKNVCTVPQSVQPAVSAVSGTPPATMYLPFAAQGFTGDDPIGLRTANGGAWGAHAYMAIYQKGQWEKVGLRLPSQADSTATTVAGVVSDFNALLTKLRAAGAMP